MLSVLPAPHRVYLIARIELVRSKRALEEKSSALVGMLISAVFGLLFGIGAIVGAYFFGTALAGDGTLPSLQLVRGATAFIVGLPAFFTASRLAQKGSIPTNTDGVLTTVPHRDAVAGFLLAEIARIIGLPLVLIIAIAVAFGIGAGSVASIVLVVVTILSLALLGAIIGFVIGFVIQVLLARSPTLARYRTAIAIVLFFAYMGVAVSGDIESFYEPIVRVISASPLGWFADLAMLAVVGDASSVRAVGAVVITVVGTPAAVACCNWLAAQVWYTSSVEPVGEEDEPSKMGDTLFGSVRSVPRPMTRIVRKTWIRAWRSPLRLLYVPYPLFLLIPFFSDIVESGSVPPAFPPLLALYGAWATGAAFTLNPIGDEGPVLPITLTSSIDGRTFIGALCLAGLTIGLPMTVVAVIVTGVLASLPLVILVEVVIAAIALCVCATAVATGAGVAFPRLEAASLSRNREVMVPSIFGFALFSLVLTVVSVPAILGLIPIGRRLLTDVLEVGTQTLAISSLGLTILFAGAAGTISYYSAVGSFDDYYYD